MDTITADQAPPIGTGRPDDGEPGRPTADREPVAGPPQEHHDAVTDSDAAETSDADEPAGASYPWRLSLAALGVLLVVVMSFLAGYGGSFGQPRPHDLDLAVSAPARVVQQLQRTEGVNVVPVTGAGAARAAVAGRLVDAAVVVSPAPASAAGGDTGSGSQPQDAEGRSRAEGGGRNEQPAAARPSVQVVVANGAGHSTAVAVTGIGQQVASGMGTVAGVTDLAPLSPDNPSGTWEFYVIIFLGIGAGLGATLYGRILGPIGTRQALAWRLATLVVFTAVAAAAATWYVDGLVGALTGHGWAVFAALWAFTFVLALVITGISASLGMAAALVAALAFTVLGNSSAGGPVARPMMSTFYRTLSPVVPQGATLDLVREIQYFSAEVLGRPLLTLALWGLFGLLMTVVGLMPTRHGDHAAAEAGQGARAGLGLR